MKKVVFLDRDGVINQDSPDYIKSWEEFHFIPGSLRAIKILTDAGYSCIVISNQSAINRKMITRSCLKNIHSQMKSIISAHGGQILDIFFCPHIPEDECRCRKPKPGLIFQAVETHELLLPDTIMIGDSVKDIESARTAGCGLAILVRTGNIAMAEKQLKQKGLFPDHVADDLFAAARWIVSGNRSSKRY